MGRTKNNPMVPKWKNKTFGDSGELCNPDNYPFQSPNQGQKLHDGDLLEGD